VNIVVIPNLVEAIKLGIAPNPGEATQIAVSPNPGEATKPSWQLTLDFICL
jgi:hypothetical protein